MRTDQLKIGMHILTTNGYQTIVNINDEGTRGWCIALEQDQYIDGLTTETMFEVDGT